MLTLEIARGGGGRTTRRRKTSSTPIKDESDVRSHLLFRKLYMLRMTR